MMSDGKLITFEGIDFSGKSDQAVLLRDRLASEGYAVHLLREPGGTKISERIRALLLDNGNAEMVKEAELLLYSAARTQMVAERILPLLRQGHIVICDRYYDSTTAYQGYAREIDLEFIHKLNNFVTHATRPDLTLLLDIDPEVAFRRKRAKETKLDRLEKENLSFHHQVRGAFLEIAKSNTEMDRFIIVDGDRPISVIHNEVCNYVKNRL